MEGVPGMRLASFYFKGWRGRESRVCPKVANGVRGERVYLQDSVRLGPGCGDGAREAG